MSKIHFESKIGRANWSVAEIGGAKAIHNKAYHFYYELFANAKNVCILELVLATTSEGGAITSSLAGGRKGFANPCQLKKVEVKSLCVSSLQLF